jgi:DNA-binding transcriptional LysR family regulator
MLDYKPLRYFTVLAECSSFRKAAEQLHITQPPLSRQIVSLEESIGVKLFVRDTRHVKLTPAGEYFYREAKNILASLQRAERMTVKAADGEAGHLKIGFTMCSAHTVVPKYVRKMQQRYPEIKLDLKEIISDDIPEKLLLGEIDVGVILETEPRAGLLTATVLEEPLCAALSRDHPKALCRELKITDLKNEIFAITSAQGSIKLRNDTLNFCRKNGFEPDVGFEVTLQQTMLSLVDDGACIALVPFSMSRLRMDGITFKAIQQAPSVRQEVTWSSANSNPCLNGFLSACITDGDGPSSD